MTDEELKEIEERANAATPGPWFAYFDGHAGEIHSEAGSVLEPYGCEGGACIVREKDLAFITNARTDVPTLIAEVRESRFRISQLLDRIDELQLNLETARYDAMGEDL